VRGRFYGPDGTGEGETRRSYERLAVLAARRSRLGGSRGVPVLVPVRAGPVPSAVRGDWKILILLSRILQKKNFKKISKEEKRSKAAHTLPWRPLCVLARSGRDDDYTVPSARGSLGARFR